MRVAEASDFAAVARLQSDVVRWLATRGLDQWQSVESNDRQTPERMQKRIADAIGRGECFVLTDDSRIVATVIIDELADPEFWQDEDDPGDALYVHRMIVSRNYAGRGIGENLVDFALRLARKRGKKWLRLDAWRTNPALHEYYRQLGFDHVRTVSLPHRGSGALFQRHAGDSG
ncbi:GNAT family N-acetyltransferase [Micromonospora sp. WMMD1082]|uniref:GNAT family N-acetyltransferase n=1 Tax=Micromonospora sp. WMMD1082 TaxID=3016104 RepID=UPI002415C723|nr:GNAT family N-acetyltransferase [Micromonospora sp. WMMD1082]MDG4794590.1 GNAT family N-acetyltransferase [Micromonospora sp. WMMD1082]